MPTKPISKSNSANARERAPNADPRTSSSSTSPLKVVADGTEPSQLPSHATIKSFAVGIFAGLCGSFAGMGGGFVMIPLMTSPVVLRLSQHTAHGTSLFAVAATGVAGALGYGMEEVEIDSAAAVAFSGMITARLGAAATSKLSGRTLKKALGVFMLAVAPSVPARAYMLRRHGGGAAVEPHNKRDKPLKERVVPAGIIGLGSGFLAGLFGVGGGAVVVPALTVCTDMTHYQALGTSLCAMSLPAVVGTVTHFQRGNLSMAVAPPLAVGAFVGAYLGGKAAVKVPEDALRWGFSGLMVVLGTKTLLRA